MSFQVTCLMSGVKFSLAGKDFSSPIFEKLYPRRWVHPIFSISPRASIDLMRQIFATPEKFTPEETYLIGMSLLSSTGVVEFHSAPKTSILIREGNAYTPASVVVQKSAELIKTCSYIAALGDSLRAKLPHFRVSSEVTAVEFIENFLETVADWKLERETNNERERQRLAAEVAESSLRKAIEKYGQDSTYVASRLANWANLAACFPQFEIRNPLSSTGVKIKLADYWKEIILRCVNDEKIFVVPPKDITELLEHCVQFLSAKDYMFHKLIQHLERGLQRAETYLDQGDTTYNVAHKSFAIIPDETSVETANTIAMIKSAPEFEPVPENYPTKLDYLKAKARWTKKVQFLESGRTLDDLSTISAAVQNKKLSETSIDDL